MKLFFNRLPEVTGYTYRADVQVEHNHNATVVVDANGTNWVAKHESEINQEGILAEAISWMLAMEIGVPVPPAAYSRDEDGLTWLSQVVHPVLHWTAHEAVFVANTETFGRVLALDAIVMNTDRHAGNILLQPDPDEYSLKAWAIDHEGAHVGYGGFDQLGLELHEPRKIARGLPMDRMGPAAMEGARLAEELPASTVQDIVNQGCEIAGLRQWAEAQSRGLLRRCRSAVSLTEQYLQAVRRHSL